MSEFFPATAMPDPDWWQALWPEPRHVLNALGIAEATVAVDLCCGDGLFSAALAGVAKEVLAIDLDRRLLESARARLARAGIVNCRFIEGDACDIAELIDRDADLVFLANTFHGVPDKQALVEAVARATRPGGLFALVNWHRRRREETTVLGQARGPASGLRMAPEQTVAAVEPAGFQLVRIVELPPYHYGCVFRLRAPPTA